MSDTQAYEVPLIEQLRKIPKDYRATIEFQWAEDGTPTGHHMIPVGHLAHRAADELAALKAGEECQHGIPHRYACETCGREAQSNAAPQGSVPTHSEKENQHATSEPPEGRSDSAGAAPTDLAGRVFVESRTTTSTGAAPDAGDLVERLKYELHCLDAGSRQWRVVNRAADTIAALRHDIERSVATNAELATENEALRKDAERYRYLIGGCRYAETDPVWNTKESLDAAIDSDLAMQA